MFKKLQNLLFEDDDDELEEQPQVEPVREPEVVREKPVEETPAPAVETPAPVFTQPEVKMPEPPVMQRIDVNEEAAATEGKKQAPTFDSLFEEPEEKPVEKPVEEKPLGITIGDPLPVEKPKPKKQVKKEKVQKTQLPKKVEKPAAPAYQFKPVISPIFGVDEKDLTAVKNTAVKLSASEKSKNDRKSGGIISPMYGADTSESLLSGDDTVKEETSVEPVVQASPVFPKDDEIPSFSLDDILNDHQEETVEPSTEDTFENTAPFDLPAFDNLDLVDNDTTVTINRPEIASKDKK